MRVLLDTHLLLWAAKGTLSKRALKIIEDTGNELYFSPANIWEIELKHSRLSIDPEKLYKNLLTSGYRELHLTSRQVLSLSRLPDIHKDPFDRILLAQAATEKMTFLTADEALSKYAKHMECVMTV